MKICCISNCNYPVFGTDRKTKKKYCKFHQHLRTDIIKTLKNKTHKERVEKLKRNKYDFNPVQFGYNSEFEMFKNLWIKSNKTSKISGRDLKSLENTSIWLNCFAHILNKNYFPLYRYNPDNILIIHPYEHYLVDHGNTQERIKYVDEFPNTNFTIFYKKQSYLKANYNKISQ